MRERLDSGGTTRATVRSAHEELGMAGQVVVHREISAPAERVWSMISDVTRMGEFSPENVGARWLGGATGPVPGARFRGTNRRGWRRWSTQCTVIEADPPRRFAFRVTAVGLAVADWRYDLEPTDTGCRITETFVDRRGALVRTAGRLLTGVADREDHNHASMQETLAALAEAAAQGPDAS